MKEVQLFFQSFRLRLTVLSSGWTSFAYGHTKGLTPVCTPSADEDHEMQMKTA